MKKRGICQKCGKETTVQDHHIYGYGEEHKDEVVPYCQSCDLKAHYKARKTGKCILTHKEVSKLSHYSMGRRNRKTIFLSQETLVSNVRLFEMIIYNKNTGHLIISSGFSASNNKKIKYINI